MADDPFAFEKALIKRYASDEEIASLKGLYAAKDFGTYDTAFEKAAMAAAKKYEKEKAWVARQTEEGGFEDLDPVEPGGPYPTHQQKLQQGKFSATDRIRQIGKAFVDAKLDIPETKRKDIDFEKEIKAGRRGEKMRGFYENTAAESMADLLKGELDKIQHAYEGGLIGRHDLEEAFQAARDSTEGYYKARITQEADALEAAIPEGFLGHVVTGMLKTAPEQVGSTVVGERTTAADSGILRTLWAGANKILGTDVPMPSEDVFMELASRKVEQDPVTGIATQGAFELAAEIPSLLGIGKLTSKVPFMRGGLGQTFKLGAAHQGVKSVTSELFGTDEAQQRIAEGRSLFDHLVMDPLYSGGLFAGGHALKGLVGKIVPETLTRRQFLGAGPMNAAMAKSREMLAEGAMGAGMTAPSLKDVPREQWGAHLLGGALPFMGAKAIGRPVGPETPGRAGRSIWEQRRRGKALEGAKELQGEKLAEMETARRVKLAEMETARRVKLAEMETARRVPIEKEIKELEAVIGEEQARLKKVKARAKIHSKEGAALPSKKSPLDVTVQRKRAAAEKRLVAKRKAEEHKRALATHKRALATMKQEDFIRKGVKEAQRAEAAEKRFRVAREAAGIQPKGRPEKFAFLPPELTTEQARKKLDAVPDIEAEKLSKATMESVSSLMKELSKRPLAKKAKGQVIVGMEPQIQKPAQAGFEKMTVKMLKTALKEKGVGFKSRDRKSDLIKKLRATARKQPVEAREAPVVSRVENVPETSKRAVPAAVGKALKVKIKNPDVAVKKIQTNSRVFDAVRKQADTVKGLKEARDALKATLIGADVRAGSAEGRRLEQTENLSKGKPTSTQAGMENRTDAFVKSRLGRYLRKAVDKAVKVYTTDPKSDFVDPKGFKKDIGRIRGFFMENRNVAGSAVEAKTLSTRQQSDALSAVWQKRIFNALKKFPRFKGLSLFSDNLSEPAKELSMALDGFKQLNKGKSLPETEIQARIAENRRRYKKYGWGKAYDTYREMWDVMRKEKAEEIMGDPEAKWGVMSHYWPHLMKAISGETGSNIPDYVRESKDYYDKTLLPRLSNRTDYVMNPWEVAQRVIPMHVRWKMSRRLKPWLDREVSGKVTRMKDMETALKTLNATFSGEANVVAPFEVNKELWFRGVRGEDYRFYRWKGTKLPAGRPAMVFEYEFKKGKKKPIGSLRSMTEAEHADVVKQTSKSISEENPYVFIQRINSATSDPIIRVKIDDVTAKMFAKRMGGLKQQWIVEEHGTEEEAYRGYQRWRGEYTDRLVKDFFGHKSEYNNNIARGIGTVLDAYAGWAMHAVIGLGKTAVGGVNILGGQAATFRELGPKFHSLGVKHYTKDVAGARKGGGLPAELKADMDAIGVMHSKYYWSPLNKTPMTGKIAGKLGLEKYLQGRLGLTVTKARKLLSTLSMIFMHVGEHINRPITAMGAWERARAPEEKGGLGLRYNEKRPHAENIARAAEWAKDYRLAEGRELRRLEKQMAKAETKSERDFIVTKEREVAEKIFEEGRRYHMLDATNRSQHIYDTPGPLVYRSSNRATFMPQLLQVTSWTTRTGYRLMAEDMPKLLTGKDPGKILRAMAIAAGMSYAGRWMFLDDEEGIWLENAAGDHPRSWPWLENWSSLQEGGALSGLGKMPTPLVATPFGLPPTVKLIEGVGTLATAAAPQLLGSTKDPAWWDKWAMSHGDTLGVMLGRMPLDILQLLAAEEDESGDLVIKYPFSDRKKIELPKFDAWYNVLGPGHTKRTEDIYQQRRFARQVQKGASNADVKRAMWKARKEKNRERLNELKKQFPDVRLTYGDVKRLKKEERAPSGARKYTFKDKDQQIDIFESDIEKGMRKEDFDYMWKELNAGKLTLKQGKRLYQLRKKYKEKKAP